MKESNVEEVWNVALVTKGDTKEGVDSPVRYFAPICVDGEFTSEKEGIWLISSCTLTD